MNEENYYDVLPISEDHRYFTYNMKSSNNKCEGILKHSNKTVDIKTSSCYGTIDYKRGVYLYKTNWINVQAQGKSENGKAIALHFGEGIGHSTAKSVEDFFKIEGKIYQLNPVEIEADESNLMKELALTTNQ